ncbi:zinc finger protein ZIC 5 [Chaetomidium leptoderma]|uniref:Zinc finger protein ZIC 5 n=1 Tax=Chaetomidium leptoderma TaxID=669021 RepID=A0AAN6VU45_9PEZI|nr:zinc finger protein ZIC 5 [Chaetomidium leptoderma]
MTDPRLQGASTFPSEDMPFHPYYGLGDGLADSNMRALIDPNLQSPPWTWYDDSWAAPCQRSLKETLETPFFVADISKRAPAQPPIRAAMGISSVPRPTRARFESPFSSIEAPSSTSAHSPPRADSESHYDGAPPTPPDTFLSPYQSQLPLDHIAYDVQFRSMGPAYVNPSDVNPNPQSEYGESENDAADFNLFQLGQSLDSHASHRDAEPVQSTIIYDFANMRASPDQMVHEGNEASSQYPPLSKEEDTGSDDEVLAQRQSSDDTDGDYQPNKRQKTSPRAPARRGLNPNTNTASSPSRRTRNGANKAAISRALHSSSSSTNPRAPPACPDCPKLNFASQPDRDAHIKKKHYRPFNCVFDFAGCASTFASKNEWKRHVSTQHLLLHYWVCTEGTCAKAADDSHSRGGGGAAAPNGAIFNRKDLFTQHLQRMHAPKKVKDNRLSLLSTTTTTTATSSKKRTASGRNTKTKTTITTTDPTTTAWEARVRDLQATAMRARCHLPTRMACPLRGCDQPPFHGADAWNQRMEHVAKHMDDPSSSSAAAAAATLPPKKVVVFGGVGDESLVEWASRRDVAIIEPRVGGGWVLRETLKRGPGGNVVVLAPVQLQQQQQQGFAGGAAIAHGEEEEEEEGGVEGEIVVVSPPVGGVMDGEEEDAEGEEDD